MKVAYADCFSGVSGDMFLAALLDAGFPMDVLQGFVDGLGLPETVELRFKETHKGGLRAATVEVIAPQSHHHRRLSDILAILSAGKLSTSARQRAERIFTLLAEAEARVHGTGLDDVHFHEVGALDSIVDIVGVVVGLEVLEIERVYASPLPYGMGVIESAHGLLPLPAPATLELLKMACAPLRPSPAQVELVTPTGAAILAALATFEQPSMTVTDLGIGAGKRDLPWPNILRLLIGDAPAAGASEIIQIETNIDDMNPQGLGHVMQRLFEAGALDVYFTPIFMKKNRPATLLGVIAHRQDETRLAQLILSETTTLGIRVHQVYRYEAQRETRRIQTSLGELDIKLKLINGEVIQALPEYDDCVRLAREHGIRLADVYAVVNRHLALAPGFGSLK